MEIKSVSRNQDASETASRRCSSKQVFLKVSQYLQENNCDGVFSGVFL